MEADGVGWKAQIKWEENQVGEEGRPKLKGKKIKWGRREKKGGKGLKNIREREKKAKKGTEDKGRDVSNDKIAK